MGKKNRKPKKEKKAPEYRSKEERQAEVKHILEQLSEFQLNPSYEPVKKFKWGSKIFFGLSHFIDFKGILVG